MKPRKHLSDHLFRTLRDRILADEYPAGHIILEKEICEEFGVSRTPFREAIRKLQEFRLVNAVPKAGIFVTEIDIREVKEAMEVRINLEPLAAELAAKRHTAEQKAQLKRLVKRMENLQKKPNDIKKLDIDKAFHSLIWQSCNNSILKGTLKRLKLVYARLWRSSHAGYATDEEAADHLNQMLECFEKKDGETAAKLMKDHIISSMERYKQTLF